MKVIGAALHGYSLKWWRYGKETDLLINDFLEHDQWTIEQIRDYQQEKICQLLTIAVLQVPYYKDYWSRRRRKGDKASWEILDNWPVLHKADIRNNPKAFVVDGGRFFYKEHTSGSTGTPLTLYQSRKTLHKWYALYEARVRQWNEISRNDNWAIIGGQLVTKFNQLRPPFWVWNHPFHQLYLSTYHISATNVQSYFSALRDHKIQTITGYPSALTALARFAEELKLDAPSMKVIISNAEPLFDFQREVIGKTFRCPIINTYGMSELVCGASECNHGSMHIWPEAGLIEIFDDNTEQLVVHNNIGRIVTTGLINLDMPLIRYETGDRGSLKYEKCSCGKNSPLIDKIEGRMDDVIITPDGRKIGRLDPVFKTDIPIIEAQIIQEKLDTIRIKFIPGKNYDHDKQLTIRLRERLGEINIILERVERIQRGANGKFKAVISLINQK